MASMTWCASTERSRRWSADPNVTRTPLFAVLRMREHDGSASDLRGERQSFAQPERGSEVIRTRSDATWRFAHRNVVADVHGEGRSPGWSFVTGHVPTPPDRLQSRLRNVSSTPEGAELTSRTSLPAAGLPVCRGVRVQGGTSTCGRPRCLVLKGSCNACKRRSKRRSTACNAGRGHSARSGGSCNAGGSPPRGCRNPIATRVKGLWTSPVDCAAPERGPGDATNLDGSRCRAPGSVPSVECSAQTLHRAASRGSGPKASVNWRTRNARRKGGRALSERSFGSAQAKSSLPLPGRC